MKLAEILSFLEELSPRSLQESYDNSGLIIGDPEDEVSKVLVCLDADNKALDNAISQGCHLVLSHHPAIFRPIKSFTGESREGSLLIKAIGHKVAFVSAHTNFDSVWGGLTDLICKRIGLTKIELLKKAFSLKEDYGQGRIGKIGKLSADSFIDLLKQKLSLGVIRSVGSKPENISMVAVYNGSYDREILGQLQNLKPDVLVTGDLKYHDAQELAEFGLFTIDAGHYGTERIFIEEMARLLEEKFQSLAVVRYDGADIFSYHF